MSLAPQRRVAFSQRDLRLLIGFGFFFELVGGYFLLVDPAATRVSRLEREIRSAEITLETLRAAAPAPKPLSEAAPALMPAGDESEDLTIQRALDERVTSFSLLPTAMSIPPPPTDGTAPPFRRATVTLTGAYENVAQLIGWAQAPDVRLGLESYTVRTDPGDPTLVQADLNFFVYVAPATQPTP